MSDTVTTPACISRFGCFHLSQCLAEGHCTHTVQSSATPPAAEADAAKLREARNDVRTASLATDDYRRRYESELITADNLRKDIAQLQAERDAAVRDAGALRSAAEALGVIGDGYCFCSKNRDPHRYHHEPECRELRAAIAAKAQA